MHWWAELISYSQHMLVITAQMNRPQTSHLLLEWPRGAQTVSAFPKSLTADTGWDIFREFLSALRVGQIWGGSFRGVQGGVTSSGQVMPSQPTVSLPAWFN